MYRVKFADVEAFTRELIVQGKFILPVNRGSGKSGPCISRPDCISTLLASGSTFWEKFCWGGDGATLLNQRIVRSFKILPRLNNNPQQGDGRTLLVNYTIWHQIISKPLCLFTKGIRVKAFTRAGKKFYTGRTLYLKNKESVFRHRVRLGFSISQSNPDFWPFLDKKFGQNFHRTESPKNHRTEPNIRSLLAKILTENLTLTLTLIGDLQLWLMQLWLKESISHRCMQLWLKDSFSHRCIRCIQLWLKEIPQSAHQIHIYREFPSFTWLGRELDSLERLRRYALHSPNRSTTTTTTTTSTTTPGSSCMLQLLSYSVTHLSFTRPSIGGVGLRYGRRKIPFFPASQDDVFSTHVLKRSFRV
eukprot:sb/3466033/